MGCFRAFVWHLGLPWLQHESTFGVLAGVGGVGCAGVGCLSWVVFLFSVWVHFRDMALCRLCPQAGGSCAHLPTYPGRGRGAAGCVGGGGEAVGGGGIAAVVQNSLLGHSKTAQNTSPQHTNLCEQTHTRHIKKMGSGATKPEKDEIAKGITEKERPVDAVDSVDGRTMLHSAVLAGDVEAVRFLVENGAGNVRDRDGKVPLWYALQHRDADVRGRLEAELGAHAAQILVEVEDAVQVYLTHGVATTTATGVAVERSSGDATTAPLTDPHMDMAKDTNTSTGDRHLGEDDLDGDTGALRHTDGRKVEFLRKTDDNSSNNNKNSNGGEDLLCWLRGLPKVDPPLGYTDEHVRHMEAGFRVVCKRLLEDMRGRREAAGTRGGHVGVEDWMAARDPFELLLSGFLFTSDCVEYVLDSGGDVVCDEMDGTPQIAKGPDGKLRYIKLTERSVLDNHGSAADVKSQSLALYATMNTAMRAVGQLAAVKEWKGTPEKTAPNVFELSPAPPQLHVIATFAPLIRGLDRLIGSRRKQMRTVFRGINVNVSAKYALNTHIVWNCFTSTTLKQDVARSFMYGKGGTFFVVVAKEGAADVKFSSVYAGEDELLYTANIEYRVQWKLSPTLLRMMGLRFDVIVMQEVCSGVGETSAAEQVGALQEVMGHTVAFFKDYLAQYVEGRVGDDTRVDESETRPLMEEVRRWLRARGGGGGKQMSSVCTQAAAGTERKPDVEAREERQGTCGVLCVIGEGGSGKTSASIAILSDLATSARKSESTSNEDTTTNTDRNRNSVVSDVTADADAKPYFPVFVALPTVKQHLLEKGGLDRFVLESFALREADRAFLAETYEVVLVLDSLDEVGLTQEDVGAVVSEGGLLCRHPWVEAHCSVVVTVRGEYLKGVDTSPSGVCGAGVRTLYMQPFTEVDARTYIKRANTAWEKEHKEEKEKSAHKEECTVFVREEDVEGLVQLRNPFVLHMACHAQCSGKASEEVIYETYLETWTKKEMASGGVAVAVAVADAVSDVSLEDVVRAGELVACRMLETNEWQGTVGVASEVLDSQHGVCEAVRDACFRCLPFRIEDFGEERSAFTFRHKSLGEHLAARRLARDPAGTLGTLVQRSFSKDSQRVLGFFAALVCGDSELYERACTELLAAVKATRGSAGAGAGVVPGGDAGVGGEGAVTAGSNAAALLARARIPVSGEDLSGIRVSNCDLRGSLFVETALTGASFSNCWLEHTEFHTCDMGGTMLPDCSLGTPLPVLQHRAYDVAMAPDGSQMVTAGQDGSVHVWSMSSGEEVMVLKGHSKHVNGVAVTPDGTRVVSCSADRTVLVWDMHTGEVVFVLEGHEGDVCEVAVTPDSSKVVSTSREDGIRVWDLSTGMEVLAMKSPGIRSMVITKDGSQIVTCSYKVLCVWDLVTGKQEMQWPCHMMYSHALAVTPDGCHVVSCIDGAHLWNLSTGAEVMVVHAGAGLRAVAVTPDGCHVVAGSRSGNVHVWSISTGKEVTVLQGHTSLVHAVAVSPDGCNVVSCSQDDGTVRVWNITTGKETPGFERFPHGPVAVAPDGSIISYRGKRKSIWNASTGRQTHVVEARIHNEGVAVYPDGSRVVYFTCDDAGERRACVWDVATGKVQPLCTDSSEFAVFLKGCGRLRPLAVSPDASHVVTCSQTSQKRGTCCMYVWSMPTGKKVSEYAGTTCCPDGMVVTPDGLHVVSHYSSSCDVGKTVHMWKLHTGEDTMVFKGHSEDVYDVAVTRDGSRLVSCSEDETVRVWDVASGKEVFIWQHSCYVYSVALTPDEAHVVSSTDSFMSVWSMTTGEKVAEIRAHCDLHNVAVSPDGREVMCACEDNTVRVWTICTGEVGTIDGLRLKRVIGVPPTVPRALGCRNADAVEPELARRILCAVEE